MKFISGDTLSDREHYKLLTSTVAPRPIALITSVSKTGVLNIAPFSYFTIAGTTPALLSVAIQRQDGEYKDTSRNILENKEAVIHAVTAGNISSTNETSIDYPPELSEIERTDFTLTKSSYVHVPAIKESPVRMEVRLHQHVIIENEGLPTSDLLLLKVLAYHIDEDYFENGHILSDQAQLISRLGGPNYGELGELFQKTRPTYQKNKRKAGKE